jgi:malate/lactate dehydrogenase
VLGRNGVERILELKLDSEAKRAFDESASIIKDAITGMSDTG